MSAEMLSGEYSRQPVLGLPDREHMRWKKNKQDHIHAREMAEMREQNKRRMGNLTTQHYMHSHGIFTEVPMNRDEDSQSKAS